MYVSSTSRKAAKTKRTWIPEYSTQSIKNLKFQVLAHFLLMLSPKTVFRYEKRQGKKQKEFMKISWIVFEKGYK